MHFGTWLGREIENREMTRDQFAERVGINPSTLFLWLRDRVRPTGLNIARIARALELSRDEVESHLPSKATAA